MWGCVGWGAGLEMGEGERRRATQAQDGRAGAARMQARAPCPPRRRAGQGSARTLAAGGDDRLQVSHHLVGRLRLHALVVVAAARRQGGGGGARGRPGGGALAPRACTAPHRTTPPVASTPPAHPPSPQPTHPPPTHARAPVDVAAKLLPVVHHNVLDRHQLPPLLHRLVLVRQDGQPRQHSPQAVLLTHVVRACGACECN